MRESPDTLAPDADVASAAGAPVYVVTYIEVTPPSAADAAVLIQRWAAVSRGTDGNECFDAMQRITRSHHFVAVERWRDDRAFAGRRASVPHADFIRNIAPLLISGIDERVHTGLVVDGAGSGQDVAAVSVVTHVDVPPPHKEACIELLRELAAASSDDGGRAGLEIHQQRDRPNPLLGHRELAESSRLRGPRRRGSHEGFSSPAHAAERGPLRRASLHLARAHLKHAHPDPRRARRAPGPGLAHTRRSARGGAGISVRPPLRGYYVPEGRSSV